MSGIDIDLAVPAILQSFETCHPQFSEALVWIFTEDGNGAKVGFLSKAMKTAHLWDSLPTDFQKIEDSRLEKVIDLENLMFIISQVEFKENIHEPYKHLKVVLIESDSPELRKIMEKIQGCNTEIAPSYFAPVIGLSRRMIGLVQVCCVLNQVKEEERFLKIVSALGELISGIFMSGKNQNKSANHTKPNGIGTETQGDYVQQKIDAITNIFEEWRKKPKFDLWENVGKSKFQNELKPFIINHQPVSFVLPAFPFKSSNRKDKVISKHVDMAEKIAFDKIHSFCQQIQEIYPFGVSFILVSDGRVYASQFRIPLEDVLLFQNELKTLNKSQYMTIYCLEDFFPFSSEAEKRATLLDVFGLSNEQVEDRLKNDEGFNRVYCGFKHFMMEELSFPRNISFNKKREECALVAREMMKSNDAYGRLVECVFPHHIRLSIHPHTNVEKIGITMVPMAYDADFQWGTPWHNCALRRKSGKWELIRKNMAEQRQYRLTQAESGLHYYEETDSPQIQKRLDPTKEPKTIFVGNIPEDTTGPMLEELFAVAGKITKFKFGRNRRFAFITFKTEEQAEWAVRNLNGVSFTGVLLTIQHAQIKAIIEEEKNQYT